MASMKMAEEFIMTHTEDGKDMAVSLPQLVSGM
jgi:hypothetical protein